MMTKCTSTGQQITGNSASLVMEDTRVFGCCGHRGIGNGLQCNCGKVQATRCIFEDNSECGVWVNGGKEAYASLYARSYASIELVDGVIRNNGHPDDAEYDDANEPDVQNDAGLALSMGSATPMVI